MVKNAEDVKDLTKVSFSFIPSLRCNNRCSFCMYNASPDNKMVLDYDMTAVWMKGVDWSKVLGWGLYGGEPSIETDLYQRFYELLPEDLPKFVITNGTWSVDDKLTKDFLGWCAGKFHIIISGTLEHQRHQDVNFLAALAKEFDGAITLKDEDEEMHPMGRLARGDWGCTERCIWHEQPIRLGIFTTGHIILQNCDGVYPVVGHIENTSFMEAFEAGVKIRTLGCEKAKTRNVNDIFTFLETVANFR